MRARAAALRLWVEDGRCAGALDRSGRGSPARRPCSPPAAPPPCGPHHQPARRARRRTDARARAGARSPTLSSCSSTRPPARGGGADGFLVTEAVRGEGAPAARRARGALRGRARPGDEVARGSRQLANRAAHGCSTCARSTRRFPNIVEGSRQDGLDPRRDLIPVAPAAHYMIGGAATDPDGRATLRGCMPSGECACTGVHGANRLASNSLSECFVFGRRAGGGPRASRRLAWAPPRPPRTDPRLRSRKRRALRFPATRASCGTGRARALAATSPAGALIGAIRARARGEPWLSPARRSSAAPSPTWMGATWSWKAQAT